MKLIKAGNGDKGYSFGFAERKRNDVLDKGRLYHMHKLDTPLKF